MMTEVEKIKAITSHRKCCIADAMTGQEAVNITECSTSWANGIDPEQGGRRCAGRRRYQHASGNGRVIKFMAVGENPMLSNRSTRTAWHPVSWGWATVFSLIEKAQENYDEAEAAKLGRRR